MLGTGNYEKDYVDHCRALMKAQTAAYRKLVKAGDGRLDSPLEAFEPLFFGNLVLALDNLFVHRLRGKEGKDGNPLNEVRVICSSIMHNDGRLAADTQIKLDPEKSVLGYAVGDEIHIDADSFTRLAGGFFSEIEARYPPNSD